LDTPVGVTQIRSARADADIAVIGSHILPGKHPPPDFQVGCPGLLIGTGICHGIFSLSNRLFFATGSSTTGA
jgi:hypothetical protein